VLRHSGFALQGDDHSYGASESFNDVDGPLSRLRSREYQSKFATDDASAPRRSARRHTLRSSQRRNLSGSTFRNRRAEQEAESEIDGESQSLRERADAQDSEPVSDMEAACLTLALWMIGGLGMASSAVFGSDEISSSGLRA
jgi:hypothetical protein